jgi:hypothetical protein
MPLLKILSNSETTRFNKYQSLEDYLIPAGEWKNNRPFCLEKSELQLFEIFPPLQAEMEQATDEMFQTFKYFGQNKGISVYSFVDERHLLFYSTVISSSEREAAYVIDGLLHNETIKSDIHSTDEIFLSFGDF